MPGLGKMANLSSAQQKIVDRLRAGATLEFDAKSGRYVFRESGKLKHVDQRPVEVMLRDGTLFKDVLGRCYVNHVSPEACYG